MNQVIWRAPLPITRSIMLLISPLVKSVVAHRIWYTLKTVFFFKKKWTANHKAVEDTQKQTFSLRPILGLRIFRWSRSCCRCCCCRCGCWCCRVLYTSLWGGEARHYIDLVLYDARQTFTRSSNLLLCFEYDGKVCFDFGFFLVMLCLV